jgi:carbonic anhydrase/acetyltransferase-like protein (isoleucine patch superfamily)
MFEPSSHRHDANWSYFADADERISAIGSPSIASDIEIGDNCWIAAGVMVLCGVRIGAGCVIGAGSVVTKVSTKRNNFLSPCIARVRQSSVKMDALLSPRFLHYDSSLRNSVRWAGCADWLQSIPDGCMAFGNPARVIRVVSPRYHASGLLSADPISAVDSAKSRSLGHAPDVKEQPISENLSTMPALSNKAANYSGFQLGKDLALLFLGVMSLAHWMWNW